MAKTRKNWASKTEAASPKQRQALASMVEASQNQDAKSWFKTLNWGKVEAGGLSKFDAFEERLSGTKKFGLEEPKRSAKPKRKASPKVKVQVSRPSALDEATAAKALALEAAKAAPVRLLDGQPLKGTVVVRFKGNPALGKAFKAARGTYLWTVPQESFDKAKAFATTFVSLVGSKNATVESLNPQC